MAQNLDTYANQLAQEDSTAIVPTDTTVKRDTADAADAIGATQRARTLFPENFNESGVLISPLTRDQRVEAGYPDAVQYKKVIQAQKTEDQPTQLDIQAAQFAQQQEYRKTITRLRSEMYEDNYGNLYRDYGSMESIVNLRDEDVQTAINDNGETVFTNVTHEIRHNPAVVGNEHAKTLLYTLPPNLTRAEIIEEIMDRNDIIRNTGDLTYKPDSKTKQTFVGWFAEETTTLQTLRGAIYSAPILLGTTVGKWTFRAWPNKWMGVPAGITTGLAISGLGYYLIEEQLRKSGKDPVNLDNEGWAQILFDAQEAEIRTRKSPALRYTRWGIGEEEEVRSFTVEQYAALLDPKYATWWVKFANTFSENVGATVTFGASTGSILFRPRSAKIIKQYEAKALQNLSAKNRDRVRLGFEPINFDVTTKGGRVVVSKEIGQILDREKEEARQHIGGAVFRFIHGYAKSQIREQVRNPRKYWRDISYGEFGASGLASLAAYQSWGSDKTEHIDKLPFVLAGASLGPWTIAKGATGVLGRGILNPVRWLTDSARATVGMVEMTGRVGLMETRLVAPGGLLEAMEVDPKFTDTIFDFLQGRTSNLPPDMTQAHRDAVFGLKNQLNQMDEQLGGELINGMERGIERGERLKKLGDRYGVEITFEDSIGTFTKLDILAKMHDDIASMASTDKMDVRKMTVAREQYMKAQSIALAQVNELLDKVLGMGEKIIGKKPPEYDILLKSLRMEIDYLNSRQGAMDTLITQAFAYQADDALRAIQKNPLEGSAKVDEIRAILEGPLGKTLRMEFPDGTVLTGEKFMKHFTKEVDTKLNESYMQALEGRKATNLIDRTAAETPVEFDEKKATTIWDLVERSGQLHKKELTSSEAIQVSSNFFAVNLLGRRNYVRNQADIKYKAIWGDGRENMDVSELFDRTYMALDSVSGDLKEKGVRGAGLTGMSDIAISRADDFFNNAVQISTDKYFKQIGEGSTSKGLKAFRELVQHDGIQKILRENNIDLTTDMLNDPHKFARAMLNSKEIRDGVTQRTFLANLLEDKGITPFNLEIPTIEFRQGLYNIRDEIRALSAQFHRGAATSQTYTSKTTLAEVMGQLNKEANARWDDAMNAGKRAELTDANNYYKNEVVRVVNSKIWQRTMGKAQSLDAGSPTGWSYAADIETWITKELSLVKDEGTAMAFWKNFEMLFGTNPDDIYYINALKAIDDTLIQQVQGSRKFVLESTRINIGDAITTPRIVREIGETGEKETYEAATKNIRKTVGLLRDSSQGRYALGGTINLFDKLNRAARNSRKARDDITTSLNNVKAIRDSYQSDLKSVKEGFKSAQKHLIQELGEITGPKRGSFADVTHILLSKPEVLVSTKQAIKKGFLNDATRLHNTKKQMAKELGGNFSLISDDAAADWGTQKTLSVVIARGLSEQGTATNRYMKTPKQIDGEDGRKITTGEFELAQIYDPMKLNAYMDHHREALTSLLGKEHYDNVYFITNYMATSGHTLEPDIAKQVSQSFKFESRQRGNFVYGPASIISRLYAAESGRTSYRYIGAEAVAALLVNTNNDVLAAILTNPNWSKQIKAFLVDPRIPSSHASANTITWLHELTAMSGALGEILWEFTKGIVTDEGKTLIGATKDVLGEAGDTAVQSFGAFTQVEPQMDVLGFRQTTSPAESLEEAQMDRILKPKAGEVVGDVFTGEKVPRPDRSSTDFQLMKTWLKRLAEKLNIYEEK